jgi:hypothetical protein
MKFLSASFQWQRFRAHSIASDMVKLENVIRAANIRAN